MRIVNVKLGNGMEKGSMRGAGGPQKRGRRVLSGDGELRLQGRGTEAQRDSCSDNKPLVPRTSIEDMLDPFIEATGLGRKTRHLTPRR